MNPFKHAELSLAKLSSDVQAGRLEVSRNSPSRWAGVELRAGEPGVTPPAGARYVISPYAAELATLFGHLRDAFAGLIDFSNKHEFYARLAHAANDWHSRVGPSAGVEDLLSWVLQEARVVLGEIERGEFDAFLIAPNDLVIADVLRRLERGETLDEFEMASYLAHRQVVDGQQDEKLPDE